MVDENRTRIEQILSGVADDIAKRRAVGSYGDGYERGIEAGHDAELGKMERTQRDDLDQLVALLVALRANIDRLSEIERDQSRFAPLRYVRELAMTRHQMIRLNRNMKDIAQTIEHLAREIVESEVTRTKVQDKIAQDLFDKVIERTAVLERMVAAYDEIDKRIDRLEKRDAP